MPLPTLVLRAPMQGWVTSLDEVPDPVFAERMLGDGIAIDPTGSSLHAPCDGEIIAIHRAGHAVTMRAINGAELVMHVGLETVALGGEGFEVLARVGQQVKTGDLLLRFDLDFLARRAKSLLTPIVVTNGEAFRIGRSARDCAVAPGDFLIELSGGTAVAAIEQVGEEVARSVAVPLRHGIHARPAAGLAACAKGFTAALTLDAGGRRVNLRSPAALLTLGVALGTKVTIRGSGADAAAAVDAVAALIESGMGEAAELPSGAPAPVVALAAAPFGPQERVTLRGVTAAPGLAVGIAFRIDPPALEPAEHGADLATEQAALVAALARVAARLDRARQGAAPAQQEILGAHLALLDDPELIGAAEAEIRAGRSAGRAWQKSVGSHAAELGRLDDPRLRERAADLHDLERQVLLALAGAEETSDLPDRAILIAEELLPMQLVLLDRSRIAGIAMAGGGPTSHVAILAAAAGIPALVAIGPELLRIADGTALILEAEARRLQVNPEPGAGVAAEQALIERRRRQAGYLAEAGAECRLADGLRVEVFANLGGADEVATAMANGAEGCGLLRSEFLFLDRRSAPDEDEQCRHYQAVATGLAGRPLIIRTLDAGADKPLAYLAMPAEENPALGVRGIRIGLQRPELLRTQLRAILRVEPRGQCRIMLPMVASLAELRAVRALLDAEKQALGYAEPIELGIMIETPAAAVTADILAAEADFLSIGTNDLTQYVLAMDRGNPALAAELDALHPAVLRMIAQAAAGGAQHGRLTGVCGGLASEPLAAGLLVGLGVRELSATAASVPAVKAALRPLDLAKCQAAAAHALTLDSPAQIRAYLAAEFPPS